MFDVGLGEIELLERDLRNAHVITEPLNLLQGNIGGIHRVHVMNIQTHCLTNLFKALRNRHHIKTFYRNHHYGVGVPMVKILDDRQHMGCPVHHAHSPTQIIGHGRDVLGPGHILYGHVVGRVGVGLTKIFTQELDCPQGNRMHHGHVKPANKRFHGMAKGIHPCPGNHVRGLEPHKSRIINANGREHPGHHQNKFIDPLFIVDNGKSGPFRSGPGCRIDGNMRNHHRFVSGDPGGIVGIQERAKISEVCVGSLIGKHYANTLSGILCAATTY